MLKKISILFSLIFFIIFLYLFIYKFNIISLFWSYVLIEIQSLQKGFHINLSKAIRDIQNKGILASLSLISISFLYGVFHAVGPGHGKIIISTFLLTQGSKLKRGIILSMLSSLFQGISAIIIVYITLFFLDFTMRETTRFSINIEKLSYGLIAIVGSIIIITRFISIFKSLRNNNFLSSHNHHSHSISHNDLEKSFSFFSFISIIVSIGIRPCSGAIIVLLLANSIQLKFSGIYAVIFMSIGTGITTSILAILSVYGRKTALNLLSILPEEYGTIEFVINLIGLFGGVLLFIFGYVFLQASLFNPQHPFQ